MLWEKGLQAWNFKTTLSNYKNCIAGEMKSVLPSPWLGALKQQTCKLSFLPTTPCEAFCASAGGGGCQERWPPATPTGAGGEGGLVPGQPFCMRYENGAENTLSKDMLVLKDQRARSHGDSIRGP